MKKFLLAMGLLVFVATAAIADFVINKFPTSVWDGSTTTRANRWIHSIPSAEDFDTQSAEIIATQKYLTDVQAEGTVTTGTVTADLSKGRFITVTDGGAFTLAFSNPPVNSFEVTLAVTNGGAHTITWPTVTWLSDAGAAPTLLTSGVDIVKLYSPDAGVTYYGKHVGVLNTNEVAASAITPAKLSPTGWKTYVATMHNNTGAITTTGTVIGDRVLIGYYTLTVGGPAIILTPGTTVEATVTVNDQVQQLSSSNLSSDTMWIVTIPAGS